MGDGWKDPNHPLARVKELARAGRIDPTGRATIDALMMKMDTEDMQECLEKLCEADYYITKDSEEKPGLIQHYYRCCFRGKWLLVKLRVNDQARVELISFHKGKPR
jgi:hypothetical protein